MPIVSRLLGSSSGRRTESFVRGVQWAAPAAVLSRFLSAVGTILTARFLGPSAFGEASVALATALWIQVPLFMGLPTAMMHYIPTASVDEKAKWQTAGFKLSLILAVVTLGLGWPLRSELGRVCGVTPQVAAWALMWCGGFWLFTIATTVASAFERFRRRALTELAFAAIFCVSILSAWRLHALSPFGYIAAFTMAYALAGSVCFVSLGREPWRFDKGASRALWAAMLSYGLIGSIGGVVNAALNASSRLVANHHIPSDQLGWLAAYQAGSVQMAQFMLTVFVQVFFPLASRTPNKSQLLKKLTRVLVLSIPVQVVAYALLLRLYLAVLGKRYPWNFSLAWTFSFAASMLMAEGVLGWHFAACGRKGFLVSMAVGLVAGGANWGLCLWGIPRYGLFGAAFATALSCAAGTLLFYLPAFKKYGATIVPGEDGAPVPSPS